MSALLRAIASWCLAATAACALAGCTLLGAQATFTTYDLAPRAAPPAAAVAPARWQLRVDAPLAMPPLDTNRIVVVPRPGVLQFYRGARWRDDVPSLLQARMVEAFERTGRLAGVGGTASGLRTDLTLHSELRDFQADYRGGDRPVVVVQLVASLLDNAGRSVATPRTFRVEQPATETATPSVVSAFDQALSVLLPQLVDWALETATQARAQRAGDRAG